MIQISMPLVSVGVTGDAVRTLQSLLGVPVDGVCGPQTIDALKAFQQLAKIAPTGVADPQTWQALVDPENRLVLRNGDQGNDVRVAQAAVGAAVDGVYGPLTQQAVRQFQAQNELGVDGVVGPLTWKLLLVRLLRGTDAVSAGGDLSPEQFTERCRQLIATYEGYRKHVYLDSLGIKTIGIGFNLEKSSARQRITQLGVDYDAVCAGRVDLTDAQIQTLFNADLNNAVADASRVVSSYNSLVSARKFVVVDMIFNMGPGVQGFGGFVGTIAAINAGNYADAAQHMRASAWYGQVGTRAIQDCQMMQSGQWPAMATFALQAATADGNVIAPSMTLTKNNYLDLRNGLFGDTSASDLHAAFENFRLSKKPRLALFFHGGLVPKASGLQNAQQLLQPYADADSYPLFVVWESGIFDVLNNALPQIFKEALFNRIVSLVSQFVSQHAGQQLGAFTPQAETLIPLDEQARLAASNIDAQALSTTSLPNDQELNAFAATAANDPVLQRLFAQIGSEGPSFAPQAAEPGVAIRSSQYTLMSPTAVGSIRAEYSERKTFEAQGLFGLPISANPVSIAAGIAQIAYKVISRFVNHTDHGLPCTLVEEVLRAFYAANAGTAIWSAMKQETIDAFGADPACGGSALLNEIKSLVAAQPNVSITLIGHSAGAIYICNFLKAANSQLPAGVQFDVVFMAPAVRVDEFVATMQGVRNRIRQLRMFALQDALECKDAILGIVYPRSLLYLVSGVCEGGSDVALLGMQRFDGDQSLADYLTAGRNAFYSHTPAVPVNDGKETDSEHHGGFPSDATTLASTQYLLERGLSV